MSADNEKNIIVKTSEEIEVMRQANRIVAGVLEMLQREMRPGLTTRQMDRWAHDFCRDQGAEPAFLNYRGFPASLCVSINEQIVHGIPSKKVKVREGDIVSVDFGVIYNGFYGDSAITIPVGKLSARKKRLLQVTQDALERGIKQVQIGNRVMDVSAAIQQYAEENGFSVVRQFVGHGIGTSLHEAPEVPNYVQKQPSPRIIEGMVLAIEPMINVGTANVKVLRDGWTVITADRKPSAHFEHSVAATAAGPLVLSRRKEEL
ncbi:MAG: type I methionyl aminopeptidase [Candidatus Electrothrix aestuarii]|uniref:Methionine aminopeptidase n=1 Tax=Candidatus Electrothrix aestuarii TaxID=3062594 RepID=A0AAU8LWU5_9BACT|nr:type I methionyl aminopeptidase [Candidatus Electrothrix aestuarii]WPD22333.1 MAG: type I methionyl aminopeptidase [Candidatus Electrothrix sp. GW3-3]